MSTLVADRSLFRRVAPRLELAHRQRREEIADLHRRRSHVLSLILEQERLIAHRELQVLRAGARLKRVDRKQRYVDYRQVKLDRARAELGLLHVRLTAIEDKLP